MNISCHNSHRLYWHVYTCQHQLQRQHFSCTSFMSAHLHQTQIIYGHLRTRQHSTNAWVHVNRQHYALSKITWMCAHVSIGFNASHHHVCMSTTACMSKHIYYKVSCVTVYKYVHSFNPCMCVHVNHQPKPYAVSTITWILAVTIHIACIGMYIHVSISFNPTQHLSCTSLMSMHIYSKAKSSMDMYARTCQHLCLRPFN